VGNLPEQPATQQETPGERAATLDGLQLFARLEANGFPRRDGDLFPGPWIAPDAGFARLDREDAKAAEFNPIVFLQGRLHGIEYAIHGHLGFRARDSSSFNHLINDIEFDHGDPSLQELKIQSRE
jgi:hypothetical protein